MRLSYQGEWLNSGVWQLTESTGNEKCAIAYCTYGSGKGYKTLG
ncbi:hypothetical protein [Allocoleopsis sp.]